MAATGPVLLVRAETSPEDIVGMHAAAGILTSRGGMTSHAAVVARGLGKPCIVGAGDLDVQEEEGVVRVGDKTFREGDELSIDGTTGEVIAGALPTRPSEVLRVLLEGAEPSPTSAGFLKLLEWADGERRLHIRANADTPHDARVAAALGAEGIGLCRTEHMFFADERIPWVRQMILADDHESRATALAKLLPMQQQDFEGIFTALAGKPITDPPARSAAARVPAARRRRRWASWRSRWGSTPPPSRRGPRRWRSPIPCSACAAAAWASPRPEIYEMQVEAIVRAACVRTKAGEEVRPEIMVPLVGTEAEMVRLREMVSAVVDRVLKEEGVGLEILIGTMIEVPRAALMADKIAEHADFFSFGTNDLTQMTYGYSRDDAGRFLPEYLKSGILQHDPFQSIDEKGVGQLVRMACERGTGGASGPPSGDLRRARRRSAVDRLLRPRRASTTSPALPTACRSPVWRRRGRAWTARRKRRRRRRSPRPAIRGRAPEPFPRYRSRRPRPRPERPAPCKSEWDRRN